ncbi:MAG: hypothetical protein WDO74_03210 [Pseudomonadota bacterium]
MSKQLNHVRKQARLEAHTHRMRLAPSEPERVLRDLPAAVRLIVPALAR